MKNIISIALAAIFLCPVAAEAKSDKRGVSENSFALESQMRILEPGVSWYYNWGNTPTAGYQSQVANFKGIEFLPMCWNGNFNAEKIREYYRTHPEVKYLLGFNEPNFTNQANMTPQAAAEKWPEVQAIAKEFGLKLVAPAMNYSPNPPYQDPLKWFDEFVALVGKDAFDYVAVHNYGGAGVMKTLTTNFHERYGKDVWVTEFCYWPNEGNPSSYVAPSVQIASMVESLEFLEKTPWVYRYAWFKPVGQHNSTTGPNYALIENALGLDDRVLSEQGLVYVYMSDFDATRYHALDELVPATEYISREMASLGAGSNAANPKPIEISQFSSGASLDYQFDVPAAGDYKLTLTVSGVGEPTRFDPSIAVVAVNDDGTDGKTLCQAERFSLPGSDSQYAEKVFVLTLGAGRQTLRLRDAAPYQPSGIRISTVCLSDLAGVENVAVDDELALDTPVNVYSLSGVCVRKGVRFGDALDRLAPGIYIVNGKKYSVK